MRKVLKKVIQFEILYKLFIICLANPLMNEIYQTYVASRGLNFNKDIIATFSLAERLEPDSVGFRFCFSNSFY